jgi:outer membrane autotransporter protein
MRPLATTAALMLGCSGAAWGANLGPGQSAVVDGTALPEAWTLTNALLDVTQGGQTNAINATFFSALNMNGGAVNAEGQAVTVSNSDAVITGSTITSSGSAALVVTRNGDFSFSPASTVSVFDSTLNGVGAGAAVSFESQLRLSNSSVTAALNGAGRGTGIQMLDGTVSLENNTRVTGQVNGVQMSSEVLAAPVDLATLSVDASTVVGTTGSAILVNPVNPTGRPTNAQIRVANGSVLQGGNGLTIELQNRSTATVLVDGSSLNGGILVDDTSSANVTLQNNSAISGNVTNVADFTLNNGSSLSGNLTRTTNLTASNNSSVSGNVSDVQNFNVTGNSSVTGNLSNVTNLNLDNSTWTTNDGQGVTNLAMNAGAVKLGAGDGTFETLNVSTLSGSGRFIMDTDLSTHQSDLLNVSGQAAGDYDLQIRNTGVDPAKGEDEQRVVHTGAGSTAQFSVVGGQVDFGTFAYELEQRDNEWYLVQKFDDEGDPEVTPGTRSVIGLFSAAPTVWYGELSSLRSRMGELRYGEAQGGAWTRAYGNKYNMSAAGGTAYQQNQHGVSFGADAPLPVADGQWLVGVLAGYSRSDLDIAAGTSGHVDSYYLGAYTTWLSDSGYYVDAVVKANRFKNTSDVRMSDGEKSEGDYNTSGIGASVEVGKHIKLQDDWFVEPFAQVSTLWVKGEDYSLDNGMDASSNKADSFLGKLGTTVGRNFPLDKGGYVQPYVKIAAAHEFAKSNRVKVNDNTFSNDLSGSRGELGAGIAAQLTDVLQLHADVDYSNGQNVEQPWGVNVGLRYNW